MTARTTLGWALIGLSHITPAGAMIAAIVLEGRRSGPRCRNGRTSSGSSSASRSLPRHAAPAWSATASWRSA